LPARAGAHWWIMDAPTSSPLCAVHVGVRLALGSAHAPRSAAREARGDRERAAERTNTRRQHREGEEPRGGGGLSHFVWVVVESGEPAPQPHREGRAAHKRTRQDARGTRQARARRDAHPTQDSQDDRGLHFNHRIHASMYAHCSSIR
jgi:hypothetical protein